METEQSQQLETASLLSRQPSGIRAMPSYDDDDDSGSESIDFDSDPVFETNNSPENNVENSKNLNANTSSNSSSGSSSLSNGSNNGFVSGEEQFATPLAGPDEETVERRVLVGGSDGTGVGSVSGLPGRKAVVPIAKVSVDEDDDDDDENEGSEGGEYGGGGGGRRRVRGEGVAVGSYGAENSPPKVRVLEEEDDEEEDVAGEDGGVGVEEAKKVESLWKGDEVEESAPSGGGGGGVEFTDEGDAVVDSINVDVGEALRSGAAVVGVVERGEEEEESGVKLADGVKLVNEGDSGEDSSNVDVVEPAAVVAAEKEEVKEESEAELVNDETPVVEEREESEVKPAAVADLAASEGDSVEGSTSVDVEPVAAVAGEMEEQKVSEVELGNYENPVVEESASADDKAVGGDGVKLTEEGDSIVDSIQVDLGEAVRSRAAIVGEVVERKDSENEEAKVESAIVEESAPVAESVGEETAPVAESVGEESALVAESVGEESPPVAESVGEESYPVEPKATDTDVVKSTGEEDSVVDRINVDVVEAVRSGVAVVGDSVVEEKANEVKEVDTPVGENVTFGNDTPLVSNNDVESTELEQQTESSVDESEKPQSVQSEEQLNREETEPETVIMSRALEPVGELQVVAGGGEEKVQPDDVVDQPEASSAAVEGEKKTDRSYASILLNEPDSVASDEPRLDEKIEQSETLTREIGGEDEEDASHVVQEEGEVGDSDADEVSGERHDGVIVTDTDEEADSDEEGEEKELFDSAALAALLKAATGAGSDSGPITITSQDGSRLFSIERPAGLGSSLRSVRPAARPSNSSLLTPPSIAAPSEENLSEEEKKKMHQIHQLKVKFLRLVHRLGYSAEDSIAAQVLYRLALLGGRPTSPSFSLDNAKLTAMQLETEGKDDLDFSLNILVLGKSGVGKSATINSIFGEEKVKINAFQPETTAVQEISGVVDGVKIRVIDAPGLKSSGMEQGFNRRVLASVKRCTKKCPVDIMLYVDRLDSQTRDLNDLLMLKTITSSLGSSIWRSAIVTLTHASCAPPDGPSGSPLSYEVFVAQRSHIVQQSIGQAVGDLRLMNPSLMNPVSLVENHPACRKNREGQRVLPNGQAWRPQLMLLSYSLKILSEANSTSKPQDPFDHRKLFGFRARSAPLPYLLSTMLQARPHPKLSSDQGGDNADSDIDLDDLSDSDQEEEDEYDQLPPFKPLRKFQMAKLSREQKKAYFEEYDYRVKLLQKKQWKEELKRMREMKKRGKNAVSDYGEMGEDFDPENGAPAAVPVPLPDMALPPSFDSDNPAYRYRFLEPTSQFLARPVLDNHGWDHDCGYDGVNVEQSLGIVGRFPATIAAQVTKDKKDFNVHFDSSVSAKYGEDGSNLLGFDVQTIGKQRAYIVRGETKFKNLKKNKTAAGASVTFLGENVATGVKVEDQITLGKRLVLVGSTGTVRSQKDAAYGANLEVRLRESDYPIGQDQSSFVLSLMKWRGDLAIGGNLQSQFSVGRASKMNVRVSLNNKLSGQISVRTSSSDHLQLALTGLIPVALSIYRHFRPDAAASENYSYY